MKKLILFILLLNSLSLIAKEDSNCHKFNNFQRCDYNLSSLSLGTTIPVFVFSSTKPSDTKDSTPIVFLHGRGYARDFGEEGSMLEAAELEKVFDKYGDKFVFVAPQDTIIQTDDGQIGNDYWLGNRAQKRDWIPFLSRDLTTFIKDKLKLDLENLSIMGISMGAHGSLFMGITSHQEYRYTIALSPIFRSIESEVPSSDTDIFLQEGVENIKTFSIGARILAKEATLPEKLYIEIDSTDFGLDPKSFPASQDVWNNLKELSNQKDQNVTISNYGGGHSMKFWRPALIRSLEWLLTYLK